MFIVRNMTTGALVGSVMGFLERFQWPGTSAVCEASTLHGREYKPDVGPPLKLYEIIDLAPTGSGTIVTLGAPTYESGLDRVTRTVTLSVDPSIPTPSAQGRTEIDANALRKTIVDALYDADKRLRVLEAKPAITRAQFKTGLVAMYVSNL